MTFAVHSLEDKYPLLFYPVAGDAGSLSDFTKAGVRFPKPQRRTISCPMNLYLLTFWPFSNKRNAK